MAKSSISPVLGQEGDNPWREGLEQRLRERVREVIEQVLGEEVEAARGAGGASRWRRVPAVVSICANGLP
jgi:hypothetical protein